MKLYIFDVDATAIDTMIHEIDRISSLPASAFSTLSLIVAATTCNYMSFELFQNPTAAAKRHDRIPVTALS